MAVAERPRVAHVTTCIRDMDIEIHPESAAMLAEYARISIAFEVSEVFDITADPNGTFSLISRRIADSYLKDYDAHGERPTAWSSRFDTSRWAFFGAFSDGQRIGGAAVAFQSPDIVLLDGRSDVAVLWDIRVAPSKRHCAVGSALFAAAETWAIGP